MSERERQKKINLTLGCIALMVLISLPLLTDFLVEGTWLHIQLVRVEILKESLTDNGIMTWAKPIWNDPAGYFFLFFHGDMFLYPAVLLRLCGVPVQHALRSWLIIGNILTVLLAYFCFGKIWKEKYTAFLATAVYATCTFRTALLYSEWEIGGVFVFLFLPLILTGGYRLLISGEKNAWVYLSLGFAGVMRAQFLSFGILAAVFVILMAVSGSRLLRPEFRKELGMTAAAVLGMSAGFLYGAVNYIRSGDAIVNPISGQLIQSRGIQPAQLFMLFYQGGNSRDFGGMGIEDAAPIGVGLIMLAGLLLFLYLLFVKAETLNKTEKRWGIAFSVLFVLFSWMSLLIFPWDRVSSVGGAVSALVSLLREPWNLLIVPSIFGVLLLAMVGESLRKNRNGYYRYYVAFVTVVSVMSCSYTTANELYIRDFIRPMTEDDVIAFELMNGMTAGSAGAIWYLLEGIGVITLIGCMLCAVRSAEKK